METFYELVPFAAAAAALVMLIVGALRLRLVTFVASFPVLFLACGLALVSGVLPGAAPTFLIVFGFISVVLSMKVRPGAFLSRGGLCGIGVILLLLGAIGLVPPPKTRANNRSAGNGGGPVQYAVGPQHPAAPGHGRSTA